MNKYRFTHLPIAITGDTTFSETYALILYHFHESENIHAYLQIIDLIFPYLRKSGISRGNSDGILYDLFCYGRLYRRDGSYTASEGSALVLKNKYSCPSVKLFSRQTLRQIYLTSCFKRHYIIKKIILYSIDYYSVTHPEHILMTESFRLDV